MRETQTLGSGLNDEAGTKYRILSSREQRFVPCLGVKRIKQVSMKHDDVLT